MVQAVHGLLWVWPQSGPQGAAAAAAQPTPKTAVPALLEAEAEPKVNMRGNIVMMSSAHSQCVVCFGRRTTHYVTRCSYALARSLQLRNFGIQRPSSFSLPCVNSQSKGFNYGSLTCNDSFSHMQGSNFFQSTAWYQRDMPLRFDTLVENVVDPSHVSEHAFARLALANYGLGF